MRAWVNTVIWSILGFWIFSIYLNTYNTNKKYKNIFAKVLNTNCKKILIKTVNKNKKVVGTEVKYNCLLKVEYKINNTNYQNEIKINKLRYKPKLGEKINIKYNIDNHNDIIIDTYYNVIYGLMGMFLVFIVLFFTYLNLYLVLCS
tara:strand:- start:47 stop:484 length:438 start_codon:yes stop_codon:yes gene_type:complete